MAKLVTKFKYLNSNRDNNIGGYAKYIATREGVERIDDTKKISPATKKQQQFIEKIVKDFPDSKEMLEYEDYRKEQNIGNASEFISRALEDNAYEVMNTKTYADYIATRPRAERFGTHGLFTDDGVQVKLNKVSEELNLHEGNIWTVIISLRREDAERLGYNNGKRWRDMLRTQTEALATNLKIPMERLRWFAAFHNESHHPHVHLMAYSATTNEGYLTKQGVQNLRSSFAKDIFAQDLLCVYEKQTEHRNELRSQSRELIAEIISKINLNDYDNPKMEEMLVKLADRLSKTKGKKVYGYLKADVKNMIDAIVEELERDERIAKLYELWYEQREEVLRTYTEEIPKRVPLSQNKEFKSIKNAVIKEAMKIVTEKDYIEEMEGDGIEEKLEEEMGTIYENIELIEADIPNISRKDVSGKRKKEKTWWTDAYKMARKFLYGTKEKLPDFTKALPLMITETEQGNGFAMHDLGKMFMSGLGCEKSEEQAKEWFEKAYHAFIKEESRVEKPGYLRYRIGKLYSFGYGVEQNYMKAAEWYEKAVAENNPFAAYALGSLYLRGQGVEKNEEKAFELFMMAAMDEKKPNAYAQYELGKMCKEGTGTPVDMEVSEKWYRKAYNGFLSIEQNMADDKLYYRLGKMNYTGTGTERDFEKALIYFEKALELGNVDAMYGLGKLYLNKDFQKRDINKAVYYLTEAANQGNLYAERLLEIIRNNYNRYIAGGTLSLFQSIGRMIRNRIEDENREGKGNIDRRLKRKIDEKKQAHGLHQE
ncbi:MAG: sel1 repeat family protein [Eubacterium sp.]|nr:sel1 repeat family protein [Eubacterium sp.]